MRPHRWLFVCALGLASSAWLASRAAPAQDPGVVEFNRDIRPILSDNCFPCHGPDKSKRVIGLRFDTEEGTSGDLGGGRRAVVAGDLAASEMFRRISASDEAVRMPPVRSSAA